MSRPPWRLLATLVIATVGILVLAPPGRAATAPSDVALQVSFKPGAVVRLRGARFVASARSSALSVNDVIERYDVRRIERVFSASEADVDANRRALLDQGERDVPDLNRHYRIYAGDRAERDRLMAALDALPAVDAVIAQPVPAPLPSTRDADPTPDLVPFQYYTRPAQEGGLDANLDPKLAGGRGENVKIADIEYDWNQTHEDLGNARDALIDNGWSRLGQAADEPHGTAVIGMLIADATNGFGVAGLAPDSDLELVRACCRPVGIPYAPEDAVRIAAANLEPGDVLLIEQQTDLTPADETDRMFAPIEYLSQAVFDAIEEATRKGIIVVEPAGNGENVDLDALDRLVHAASGDRDSGAIIVGASEPPCPLTTVDPPVAGQAYPPRFDTTYGSRVDLHAWGNCAATTGGFDVLWPLQLGQRADVAYANRLYTGRFTGTSSASAMVAGAAALYSSVFQGQAGRPPKPRAVLERLQATGTPQGGDGSRHIGPQPDVLKAVTGFDSVPPQVAITKKPPRTTGSAQPRFEFSVPPDAKAECRLTGDQEEFVPCASSFTPQAELTNGLHTFEVRATDLALNTGDAEAYEFAVNKSGPSVTIVDGPSGPGTQPTFTFSLTGSGFASVEFECRTGTADDPGTFEPCQSPYKTAPLNPGVHTLEVRAISIEVDAVRYPGPIDRRKFLVVVPAPPPNPPLPGSLLGSSTTAPGPPPGSAPVLVKLTGPAQVLGGGSSVRLPLKVKCPKSPPTCLVSVKVTRTTPKKVKIGKAEMRIPQGTSKVVTFTVTKVARRTFKRMKGVMVRVRLDAAHGDNRVSWTRTVLVRRR